MYRVFIVDDEPFIIEGLYDIIDWADYGLEIVGHAGNGQKALEALRHTPVDVLITDISMPVMNGLDLIRGARQQRPELKAIVLSGFSEFEYLKEGMKLGIENYLLKPINVDELSSTLTTTVAKLHSSKTDSLLDAYGKQILKDNTLYRWLMGQIAPAEFRERAELLGLSLNQPYIAVAVLHLQRGDSGRLLEKLNDRLKDKESYAVFRDVDGDLVIAAALPHWVEGKREFLELMAELGEELEEENPVQIGIGSIGQLPDEAVLSYEEAKKSLQYFLIYPEHRLIDYSLLPANERISRPEFPVVWQDYAKLILAKDKDQLLARIAQDFEDMQAIPGVTPEYVQDAALELMVRFKMTLQDIKHTEESDLFRQGFDCIRNASSYTELVEAIGDVACRVIESLVKDVKSPVVHQVLRYIHDHYAEELSLKTLGAHYHIHPVYLGQLFHKEAGETFTEYINKYRVERAKEQLVATNLKVHEIARSVGYWETGYFYKQFKKYVGISPTEYKSLH
ncbi:DNA-binding response regulator [Paenibacillus sp. CAA11]|uniref:response regulator transcription factor n=1 Tax=Paenibacillus sp. CAA11 TaxID=1532905 RepID=UPI000D382DD3|nr:response regulator transcription factor [Paenibacillus sp. CAA11]AWB43086.1 DNA-binding response regulator [Paenibacillus sp. CAA11]